MSWKNLYNQTWCTHWQGFIKTKKQSCTYLPRIKPLADPAAEFCASSTALLSVFPSLRPSMAINSCHWSFVRSQTFTVRSLAGLFTFLSWQANVNRLRKLVEGLGSELSSQLWERKKSKFPAQIFVTVCRAMKCGQSNKQMNCVKLVATRLLFLFLHKVNVQGFRNYTRGFILH